MSKRKYTQKRKTPKYPQNMQLNPETLILSAQWDNAPESEKEAVRENTLKLFHAILDPAKYVPYKLNLIQTILQQTEGAIDPLAVVDLSGQSKARRELSAIHLVQQVNMPELVAPLLAVGCAFDHACSNGDTPLHAAVQNNSTPMIDVLMRAGADYMTPMGSHNILPVQYALDGKHNKTLRTLLEHGAFESLHTPMRDYSVDQSILESFSSAICLQPAILRTFLTFGANPYTGALLDNGRRDNLLLNACCSEHAKDNITALLDLGVSIAKIRLIWDAIHYDGSGVTPLLDACQEAADSCYAAWQKKPTSFTLGPPELMQLANGDHLAEVLRDRRIPASTSLSRLETLPPYLQEEMGLMRQALTQRSTSHAERVEQSNRWGLGR